MYSVCSGMKWRKGASHLRRQVALCYPLKVLLTCHSQTADMLPQQSNIFTTCLSCVFLPWHFLLVHPPTGIRGHGALLSLRWHYTPSAHLFSPRTEAFTNTEVLRLNVEMFLWMCDCICVFRHLCVNVNALWTHSVSWQPLVSWAVAQCCSVQAALLHSLGWIYKALI